MNVHDKIQKAMALSCKGTEWDSNKRMGRCPLCGERAKVVTTKPQKDGVRIRFHQCGTPDCLICVLELQLKSVEKLKS